MTLEEFMNHPNPLGLRYCKVDLKESEYRRISYHKNAEGKFYSYIEIPVVKEKYNMQKPFIQCGPVTQLYLPDPETGRPQGDSVFWLPDDETNEPEDYKLYREFYRLNWQFKSQWRLKNPKPYGGNDILLQRDYYKFLEENKVKYKLSEEEIEHYMNKRHS